MKKIYRAPAFLAVAILLFFAITAANAASFTVNTTADTVDAAPGNGSCADSGGMCSLRAAIMEANALAGSDTINLSNGTYTQTLAAAQDENSNAGGDWDISSNITITGTNSSGTILQAAASPGAATERVLDVLSGTVVINKVTVRNGRFAGTAGGSFSLNGAGVQNLANLTLNDVIVRDNRQDRDVGGGTMAGGIYNGGGTITINNSTVTANQCNNAIDNCRGGGLYSYPFPGSPNTTVTISNSHFDGNSASYTGAGFLGGFGAGMGAGSTTSSVNITNSSFNNNTATGRASWGAGMDISAGAVAMNINVSGSTFDSNTVSTASGGTGVGVYFSARSPGPITATFDKTSISGNTGNSSGGGMQLISVDGSLTCTITNSAINNNSAGAQGGGILFGNQSSNVAVVAALNLTNSTMSGNSSKSDGGGLHTFRIIPGGTATSYINFSTIAGNTADSDNNGSGDGGGLSANVASNEGRIELKNSIVADNIDMGGQAHDISRTVISGGYNHIENTAGSIFSAGTGDAAGSDPDLGTLALNGGTTMNKMPSATSPVLNSIPSGSNDCGTVANDQKGVVRPSGGACDKGATERGLIIVTNNPMPSGTVGFVYGAPVAADYGQPTYTYSVIGGSVPTGMTLNANGTWSGLPTAWGTYNFTVLATDSAPVGVRGSKGESSSSLAANTAQKDLRIVIMQPTAAAVSVSGRVTTSGGAGIRNATVHLVDQNGAIRSAQTGSFGYYVFENVQAGRSYTITVSAKRFRFGNPSRVVQVTDDISGIDYVSEDQF